MPPGRTKKRRGINIGYRFHLKAGTFLLGLNAVKSRAAILIEILESSLSDLKTERVHTENREMHAAFIEREKFVGDLIKRLKNRK